MTDKHSDDVRRSVREAYASVAEAGRGCCATSEAPCCGPPSKLATSAEADAFAAAYFAVIDADRDGVVSRAEYVGASLHGVWWPWLQAVAPDVRESFLADGFARHDLDRNGDVDAAEFVACTGIDHATSDEDGDGRVSVLEFYMLGLAIG